MQMGLAFNPMELEVKVLDYYQCIIEFEEDYLEVVNKEIFNFVGTLALNVAPSISHCSSCD